MKNLKYFLTACILVALSILTGCNWKKSDRLVAQVETEKIYQSDVDFLKRSVPRP